MEQEGENGKQHSLNWQDTSVVRAVPGTHTVISLESGKLPAPPPDERVKQELLTWKLEDPWMVFLRFLSFLKGRNRVQLSSFSGERPWLP